MPDDPKTAATDPDADQTPAPKYLTIEDFNKAASARDKRFEAKQEKLLADFYARLTTPKEPDATPDADPKPEAKPVDATTAEMKRLARELEKVKAEREGEKKLREAGEQKSRTDEERATVLAALTEKGVTGPKARAALALLHTEDKRVVRDEDGKIIFRDDDGPADFRKGFEAWINSEEGKHFLPARGAAGSGTAQGGQRTGTSGKPMTKKQIGMEMLKRTLTGQRLDDLNRG